MNFLRKFMYGRYGSYGMDALNLFLMAVYFLLYLVSLLFRIHLPAILDFLVAGLFLFRVLSRNIPRRQAENAKFLSITAPLRSWWRTRRMIHTDKEHRYFKCPNCGQHLRVPRGQGKIKVTCRACGTSFETNS